MLIRYRGLALPHPPNDRIPRFCRQIIQISSGRPLATADQDIVTAWLAQWTAQEAATQARKVRTLRSLYRFGQAEAGWPTNPFLQVSDPHVPDHLKTRMPTPAQVDTLLHTADKASLRTAALVAWVFGTGCRIQEVADTTWAMVSPAPAAWIWRIPGRTQHASLALRPEIITRLRRWRCAQGLPENQWASDDTTPIFPNVHGLPSLPVTLTATIRRLALKAGLPQAIPAFGLRHAHAGQALTHGASLQMVQRALGHHRIASTARYLTVVALPQTSSDFLPTWD